MRVKVISLALLAAMALALLGCGSATSALARRRPIVLTVLHTNDVMGFTEPCG